MTSDESAEPDHRHGGLSPRLVGGGLVVAAVVAFVAQNTDDTEVTWLFFDVTQPLWIVLVVTAAATLLAGELLSGAFRRHRRKDRD